MRRNDLARFPAMCVGPKGETAGGFRKLPSGWQFYWPDRDEAKTRGRWHDMFLKCVHPVHALRPLGLIGKNLGSVSALRKFASSWVLLLETGDPRESGIRGVKPG